MLSRKKEYNPHKAWCDIMVGTSKSYISVKDVAKQKPKGLKLSGEDKATLARQLSAALFE